MDVLVQDAHARIEVFAVAVSERAADKKRRGARAPRRGIAAASPWVPATRARRARCGSPVPDSRADAGADPDYPNAADTSVLPSGAWAASTCCATRWCRKVGNHAPSDAERRRVC